MIIKTGRFGQLNIDSADIIEIPHGMIGFPDQKKFCLVDPGDETLILWLQSIDEPTLAFPLLEPKIIRNDYIARLSANEMRELALESLSGAAVFSVLTIPADVTQMTVNLKAPLVINLKNRIARQVVLQENDYSIKHNMFKELRTHLMTIEHSKGRVASEVPTMPLPAHPMKMAEIPHSGAVRSLQQA